MLELQPYMALLIWVKSKDIGQKSMKIFSNSNWSNLKLNHKYQKNHVSLLCRILWLLTIAAGFTFAIIVITPLYNRFTNNPIIRSIESNNYPIKNITFPAVTICSNNKVMQKSKLYLHLYKLFYSSGNGIQTEFHCWTRTLENPIDEILWYSDLFEGSHF